MLDDELFWKSLGATTYYTLGAVPLVLIVSFAVAMLLNQRVRGLSLWRTIFYLPTLVPAIANVVLWIWIFNPDFGLLNSLLRQAGLPGSQWIYDEGTAIPSLIIMSTWGFGNTMVIFLAGLQGVPRHLYEAVAIDGGGPLRRFWHVTPPMMTPTIFYNLVVGVLGTVLTCSIAAFSFSRLRWRGRDVVFAVLLSGVMLPYAVTLISTFVMWQELGALDTILPLTVPSWFAGAGGGVFNVFLLRQFFLTIPFELDEAAYIDRASPWRVFWTIVMPLSRPAIVVVTIFTFIGTWNDFLGPLLYLQNEENYTLSLGLASF